MHISGDWYFFGHRKKLKRIRETFSIKIKKCSKIGIGVSKRLTKRLVFRSIERNDNYSTDFRREKGIMVVKRRERSL